MRAFLLLMLVAACRGRVPPDAGSFRALTYNVAGLPQGVNDDQFPEQNIPQISPKLNAYDLVMVQEDFEYSQLLREQLTLPYASYPLEGYTTPEGDGLNVFSTFAFDPELERVRWSTCYGIVDGAGDCLASKGFASTTIALSDDVGLTIVDLHGEAGDDPLDVDVRRIGFEQLAQWLHERHEDDALLVAGDTNLHGFDPEDEPILSWFLDDVGLTDACRSLGCGDEEIDRFFLRASPTLDASAVRWSVAGEFVDADGKDLSDHLAVTIDVDWQER